MSILKKPYEVSIWSDVWDNSTNSFIEEQVAIIGSDTMTSQYRVLEPKLKRNVNGSNELTFKMHRRYKDSATGEQITNPFIDLITNETKIKLKHDGKWYDCLVKNIQQDSNNATYTYSTTDLHITELSKNGYGLVLDASLMNNMGTVNELAGKILKDTGWSLAGDLHLDEIIEEQLVEMTTSSGLSVHVPYSSLKNKPEKFQYFTSLSTRDEYGVYSGTQTSVDITETNPYTTDERAIKFGFYYPTGWKFIQITPKRAHCKVFTHKSAFNPALNKIVYFYNNGAVAGYSETKYITPNLISNLITNNTFKSTTGWTGSYSGGEANQGADLNAEVKSSTLPRDLLTDMMKGNYDPELTYTPCLRIKLKNSTSIVVNSGPYDNRTLIKEYSAGQKFVLFYKETTGTAFTAKVGARNYSPESGQYNTVFDKLLMTFSSSEAVNYVTNADTTEFDGYRYIIAEVRDDINLTQKETQKLKAQLFLSGAGGAEYSFSDFQLFPFIPETEGSSVPMLPVNVAAEAKAVTKYYYYNVEDNPVVAGTEGYVASAQEYKYLTVTDSPVKDYKAVYSSEKIRSIDVKQSNYFNAIQSLCEAFECWAVFEIGHTDAGKITSKSVILKQYIDKPNHAGFRYGVNLKQSKRTIDSKQVVTKLIVPDSVNEHAPNGFCSIARAGANPSGENYIYNFQYYINMGLLNEETVDQILYNPSGNYGEISSYYTKLLEINQELTRLTDDYTSKSLSLMQAHADLQVAENGRIASEETYQDAADSFAKITGYDFQELNNVEAATTAERDAEIARRKDQIEKDKSLQGFLTTVAEYYSAWQKYCAEEAAAQNLYDTYKTQSDELYQQIETYNKQKTELNKAFFAVFYRFIQEGTWKGDEHTDHEKYYFDAKTTSDNSCMPKVTYSFSVLDLSGIKDSETWTDVNGYEALNFNLADKTWVEDPEIFGNAREEVVITEITYALDEPDKNTIKVQNYKDQFADLFQKQTATVQQVQFAKGAWSKSTKFTEEQPAGQAAFLQNALANAELILQNAGEQSVVWDKNGIIVTDVDTPSQQLRIVGGAIMMRDEDEDGLGWKVGITSKGINAKLITAGQINTGLIQIMNGEEPYFRWDAYGITAYYFDTTNSGNGSYNYGLNTHRGVRFDRLGIYGYRNPADKTTGKLIDGATWHPESPEEVQQYAQFALTWDGLYLNLGHATYSDYYYYNESNGLIETGVFAAPVWHAGTAQIGKTSKYLFNKWVTNRESPYHSLPYYDPKATDEKVFAKIFAVGGADGNDELAIYDDGTLVARRIKLIGSIEWTKNSSPSKSVYGKIELTEPPADNTPYVNIPEEDGDGTEAKPYVWHQVADISDSVYAHTDNGGATWEGPFLITGLSIEYTIVQYCMADRGTDPELLDDTVWSEFFPVELIDGKCVFTRAADKYNNGQQSAWRYSVGYIGTSNYRIVLDNDYASIPVKNQVNPKEGEENIHDIVDNAWSTSTTARVYYGDKPDTHTWIFSAIDSQTSNGLTGVVSYNTITIRPQTAGKLAGEEHVVGIQAYNADSDTTLYTSFTAAKLHAGDDAIGYKVVGYPTALVRHHNTDNVFTPDKFKLQALKKIGTNQFEACTGYWKYSINNNENEIFLNEGAAASEITIQPDALLGETDKSTLKSLDVYFYLNSTDKVPADKEIITVAEDGKDGVSIKGIDELYYASASDKIEDVPEVDVLNPDTTENLNPQWKREISKTGYGEELCYLWNVEKMLLSEDGTENTYSSPALIAVWGKNGDTGRGLDAIVSYYFVNQSTIEPPVEQPSINPDDVAVIIVPDGWMTSTTDFPFKAGDCLWEKSFYKYTYALEDGNIYQPAEVSIVRAIPKDIYRLALTNDSGVVVTDKNGDGGAFGDNVKTKVIVYKGDEDDTANWTITGTSADLKFSLVDGAFQVTGFVADQQVDPDNGYLTLTATHKFESKVPLTTTFKISKLKQGEPGADAVAYWLTCSGATIVVSDKGEYTTPSITFEGKQQVGTAKPTDYTPTQFEIYVDGVLTETLTNVSQVICTLGDGVGKYKVSSSLTCKMYLNEVVVDTQTAEVVRDGASLSKMEVFNWYFATDASSGVTIDTEGWTLEIANAQITESKRYLWNYESITSYKEDGSVISATQSEPSIIGVYGQTGPTGVSISSIKDYYGVSASKTEEPSEWYNGTTPGLTSKTPYLWTYEKFVYSDGTVIESSKRIISELSISIETIKDWFLATEKESEKPAAPTTFASNGTPTGWSTLDACGHGESKPFLWTVEVIDYNHSKEKQITEVTLVTRVARSIKAFYEYYCITNISAAPSPIVLATDGNSYTTTGWTLADADYIPTIEQGEWLWNQEVVEYTTKDNEGRNKYSTTSVQQIGYSGTDGGTPDMSPTTQTITVYSTSTTNSAPTLPSGNSLGVWTLAPSGVDGTSSLFEFKVEVMKSVTYSGTTPTISYSNAGIPELVDAWYSDTIHGVHYAQYLNLTGGGENQGLFPASDGSYYLNASYINTGLLTISDGTNTIFSAGYTGTGSSKVGSVQIGAFTVNQYGLVGKYTDSSTNYYTGIGLRTDGEYIAFFAGGTQDWGDSAPFRVTNKGVLTATKATITGSITATSGYIGPSGDRNSFKIEEMTMTSSGTKHMAIHRGLTYNSSGDYYSFTNGDFPMVLCPHGVQSATDLVENGPTGSYWVFLAGKVANGRIPFGVTDQGGLYASAGNIAGFSIGSIRLEGANNFYQSLYYGLIDTDSDDLYELANNSFILCPSGIYVSTSPISDGPTGNYWKIIAGENFGVTSKGALYATGVTISGNITASSGSIGVAETSGILKINASISVGGSIESSDGENGESNSSESSESITYFMKDNEDNPLNVSSLMWGLANNNFYLGSGGLMFRNVSTFTRDTMYDGCRLTSSGLVFTGTGGRAADVYGQNIVRFNSGGIFFHACGYNNLSSEQTSFLYNSAPSQSPRVALEFQGVLNVGNDVTENAQFLFNGHKTYWRLCMGGALGEDYPTSSCCYDFRMESNSKLIFGNNNATTNCPYIANANLNGSSATAKLYGTWETSSGTQVSSDRRLKYDITAFDSRHEVLFDNLQGRTFKYIDGISGRVHFGLIADELLQALEIAGFTTKEVASYCAPTTEEDFASVRYSELIALNTWQIQKLKPRMTIAEEKIARLEQEILKLKQEIATLKQ